MELLNATRMQAGYTLGMDPDGRERVVVAVKGTFTIPQNGARSALAQEQMPLLFADEFTGEPGLSATRHESDFAPLKPRCDVLLTGSAHAPSGRETRRVTVGLRVGSVRKEFDVVGDRVWRKSLLWTRPSAPQPFTTMPISYDRAFGGAEGHPRQKDKTRTFADNPIGVGYYPLSRSKKLLGRPLPNTEESGRPALRRKGNYPPQSFGPVSRNFASRVTHAGTYDQAWLDNGFPFLPTDFDPLYYQCAPADQQMDYPEGGEEVELINLTPEGRTRFLLPKIEVPVEFTNVDFERTTMAAVLDTVCLEPDQRRFTLVWRASISLKRNIFEISQGIVGRMPRGWYRARNLGKTYYPSLAQLATARAGGENED